MIGAHPCSRAPVTRGMPEPFDDRSVLNQATDRHRSDMTGRRKRPRQGKTDVDQRRAAQTGDIRYRRPDRLNRHAIRFRPQNTTSNPDLVKNADVLVLDP